MTAKSVTVGVEMWPLIFSRVLHVTGLTIDQPQATLLRNGRGHVEFFNHRRVAGRRETGARATAGVNL